MNLKENILEGIGSIRSNILRTVLTGLIIAIGITSLVGMLTAVDGIKAEIDASLANLGPIHLTLIPNSIVAIEME